LTKAISQIWDLTVVVIEIPTHARIIGLEPNLQKQEEKLGRFTSSPYVCHTKAMTALVEYRIKCLH